MIMIYGDRLNCDGTERIQYRVVQYGVLVQKRVVRRRDSSLPTRVCVPLVFNKVYKVSTITIDLLLLLLYCF